MPSSVILSLDTATPGQQIVRSDVDLVLVITVPIQGSLSKPIRLFYTPISDSMVYLHKPSVTKKRGIVKATLQSVPADSPSTFTATIKAENLHPSYHYLVFAYSKADGYVPAGINFLVDGDRAGEPADSTDTAGSVGPSVLTFDAIPNSTTVPHNADLTVTIHAIPAQAGMIVSVDRYVVVNNVLMNKKTYIATIDATDPTIYRAIVPDADLDPNKYYSLFAYADKSHVPCSTSFHTKP